MTDPAVRVYTVGTMKQEGNEMTEQQQHPAVGKDFEVIIGGIWYPGNCFEVWEDNDDGSVYARCKFYNTGDFGSSFNVEVDTNGKPV